MWLFFSKLNCDKIRSANPSLNEWNPEKHDPLYITIRTHLFGVFRLFLLVFNKRNVLYLLGRINKNEIIIIVFFNIMRGTQV
jgi:hypothetical protein